MSPISNLKRRFALDEIEGQGYFHSIDWVETIDSTNKHLVRLVRQKSISLPALLVADQQTSGVGRGSNPWWSPSGCLMFSIAVPLGQPDVSQHAAPTATLVESAWLPLRVGCTIAECLERIASVKPMVKWPNDVYISGRKVSGVLIEVIPGATPAPSVAVIGIGINCQVDFQAAPLEIQAIATSLHLWAQKGMSELVSTENVLVQFVHQWLALARRNQEDPTWLFDSWPERSLLDGLWVEIKHSTGVTQGLCLGISQAGAILIQDERLNVTEILAGTVLAFRPLDV